MKSTCLSKSSNDELNDILTMRQFWTSFFFFSSKLEESSSFHVDIRIFFLKNVMAQDENNDSVFEKDNWAAKFKSRRNTNRPKYLEDCVTN